MVIMAKTNSDTKGKISPKETSMGYRLVRGLSGHTDVIGRISWSPDGRLLASASRDRTLRIWNPQTGQVKHVLDGHKGWVIDLDWSPDAKRIVTCADDRSLRIWDVDKGKLLHTMLGHDDTVKSVAWSPDGSIIASGSEDKTIRFWDGDTGSPLQTLQGHAGSVLSLAWSPDGQKLVSGSEDTMIRLWSAKTGKTLRIFKGHSKAVYSVCWSPDGELLASSSNDKTARIWSRVGREISVLEGHTNGINCVSFSCNARLLATKADGIRLWRTDTWELLSEIEEPDTGMWPPGLAFHPYEAVLATLGDEDKSIRLWAYDLATMFGLAPSSRSVQYANAKVVLLGESGVGKSALGMVLSGRNFIATESTHARHVWTFDIKSVELADGRRETRETLIWDMAGQPGYRLVHQLHLDEVAVALILFDARSETDPFAGVYHWIRAIDQAHRVQGDETPKVIKILVSARADRGRVPIGRFKLKKFMAETGIELHVETSAKEGWGVEDLRDVIHDSIPWDDLPRVTSPELFKCIKDFVIAEKKAGRVLVATDNLQRAFLESEFAPDLSPPPPNSKMPPPEPLTDKALQSQFEACIARVQARGLIRLLSFGDLVLLQPELLDAYASALIEAARDEPTGFGAIKLVDAQTGNFRKPSECTQIQKQQEQLLLLATIEDMLGHEIALGINSQDESYLVFPSQFTREHPEMPDPAGKAITFQFEGPIINIYSTLAVRLSHSGVFKIDDLWKNAAVYGTVNGASQDGAKYGMYLEDFGDGLANLTLFFNAQTSEESRQQFETFVATHLKRHCTDNTIKQWRIISCPNGCQTFESDIIEKRRARNLDFIVCQVCDQSISITEAKMRTATLQTVNQMDQHADYERDATKAAAIIAAKRQTNDFDVFLCYSSSDRTEVKDIAEKLKEYGILPWLDEWELPPGREWFQLLEQQIDKVKSGAIFIGESGIGPYQTLEARRLLMQYAQRGLPLIPVILNSCKSGPEIPGFLETITWVDFRKTDDNPLERMIWGITGKKDKDKGGPQ